MEFDFALDMGREALITALKISLPILGTGIVIGLVISLLQTLTQLQDQTLSLVPKIVAMVGAAVFFMPWLAHRVIEYSQNLFFGF